MAIILFDTGARKHLQPFTLTRAVADIRMGIFTARERWEQLTGQPVLVHTEPYLRGLYPGIPGGDHTWVDASVMVTETFVSEVTSLAPGHSLRDERGWVAARITVSAEDFDPAAAEDLFKETRHVMGLARLEYPWQIMQWNDQAIRADYSTITRERQSQPLPDTVLAISPENIFIEEGALLSHCIINAATGPVYIGRGAEIMEGAAIRGPFVLGEGAVVKMNSRIYGATTLGPRCLGGGEIKNSVMMGYSNKAHDGYLGDSVVGEWCNFGAGSTNSNIKNTAGTVKVWSMAEQEFVPVGNKCGMIMGDYSRVSINASINTGSMIGISCNVFGEGLLPVLIHNFSWGVTGNTYTLDKALQDINNWKNLKGQQLNETEEAMLRHIFAHL